MEAHDGGAGGGEGQGDEQGDPSQGISAAAAADEGIDPGELSEVVVIPHGAGSGARAMLVVGRLGPHLLELYIRVPFVSPTEAQITRSVLSPFQDTPEIHRELIVNGRFMMVRWVAEDPHSLRAVFTSFIVELYTIFLHIQFLMPLHFNIF